MSCKTCTICLEEMNEKNVRYLPCCHGFHTKCIDEWLKTNDSCPECRLSIANGIVFDGSLLAMSDMYYDPDQGVYLTDGSQYFTEVFKKENGSVYFGKVNIFNKNITQPEDDELSKSSIRLIPGSNGPYGGLMLTKEGENHPHAIAKSISPWDGDGLYNKLKMAVFKEYIGANGLHKKYFFKNENDLISSFSRVLTSASAAAAVGRASEVPFLNKIVSTYSELCNLDVGFVRVILSDPNPETIKKNLRRLIKAEDLYKRYITNLGRKIQCAFETNLFILDDMNAEIRDLWETFTRSDKKWILNHEKNRKEEQTNLEEPIENNDTLEIGDMVKKIKGKGKGQQGRIVFIVSKLNRVKVRVRNIETGRTWGLQYESNYVRV